MVLVLKYFIFRRKSLHIAFFYIYNLSVTGHDVYHVNHNGISINKNKKLFAANPSAVILNLEMRKLKKNSFTILSLLNNSVSTHNLV